MFSRPRQVTAIVFLALAATSSSAALAQVAPSTPPSAQPSLPQAAETRDRGQPPADSEGAMRFSAGQIGLASSIIALLAFLFFLLFYWQQRGEQAGYFGRIYQDTVKNLELGRLAVPIDEKWSNKTYLNELLRESSDRARKWLSDEKNAKPAPSDRLGELAQQLGFSADLRDMAEELPWILEREAEFPVKAGTTRMPGFGNAWDSAGAARPSATAAAEPGGPSDPRAEYEDLRGKYRAQQRTWATRAAAEAWNWYQNDRKSLNQEAESQAKRALNIDFSTLRGRGPEFVLEFTAVVVIIFSAVILGILSVLKEQQIGTLLAAIAGYVLGRATTRGRATSPEQAAAPAPPATAEAKQES